MICTDWQEFKSPDFCQIRESLTYPVIFDGRNLYGPETLQQLQIDYYAIGRGLSVDESQRSYYPQDMPMAANMARG